jgi:anti-sigma-K factor RskA
MMDETKEELLVGYLLNELDPIDAEKIRAEIRTDPEVSDFVRETEEAFASIAYALQPIPAPTGLPERIVASERAGKQGRLQATRSNIVWLTIPWALAACLAVTCTILSLERATLDEKITQAGREMLVLRQENARIESDLATLRKRNALAEVKIMMLRARVAAFESATAVVVWDKEQKNGVLQLDKLPPPGPGKDYQLWVIDPHNPQPVSAGVFTVLNNGPIRTNFWPRSPIESASTFAISLEKSGGAPKPEGQIILVGE